MKLAILAGGAVGYVLGAKAGRERYESIVASWRRVGGSQTVQSVAGVLQAQLDEVSRKVRESVGSKVPGRSVATSISCWTASRHCRTAG